jgi:hypothetical protein
LPSLRLRAFAPLRLIAFFAYNMGALLIVQPPGIWCSFYVQSRV